MKKWAKGQQANVNKNKSEVNIFWFVYLVATFFCAYGYFNHMFLSHF